MLERAFSLFGTKVCFGVFRRFSGILAIVEIVFEVGDFAFVHKDISKFPRVCLKLYLVN